MVLEGTDTAGIRFDVDADLVSASSILANGRRFFSTSADAGTVAMLMTNDQVTVEVLLGAIEAGTRVVSLPIPSRSADPVAYLSFIESACRSQGVTEIVARDDIAELLEVSSIPARSHRDLSSRPVAAPGSGFELVQFSSGSTNAPKAVRLDDAALGANVEAIIAAIEPGPDDWSVSWLPLSHDMGLIGMLFTSLATSRPGLGVSTEMTLLDPADFLRRPDRWIDALATGATITAAPDFAYRMCVERAGVPSAGLGQVRHAIVGGETIRATTLRSFAHKYAPAGFRPEAFCPAYGLAEIGLAATMATGNHRWTELEVDTVALAERRLQPPSSINGLPPPTVLVASGRPIPGYQVRCDAPGGQIGPVEIAGPSHGIDAMSAQPYAQDGWLRTGDLGAVVDGELFVSGRGDDHIVTASRNIYAPAVEDAVSQIASIRAGRVAALGLSSGEWIIAAEPAPGEHPTGHELVEMRRQINRAAVTITSARPSSVVIVPRGRLPMTPSGKLQRQEALRRYLTDEW